MSDCKHKTLHDHSRVIDVATLHADGPVAAGGPVRLWTCSDCGGESPWTARHEYYGNLECRECSRTSIDRVSCGCTSRKGRRVTP